MRKGNTSTRKKTAGPASDEDNVRKSAVTFSDANMVKTIRSFNSSTTRTVAVDANEQLEAHLGSTSFETVNSFGSISTTRTVVVDAKEHLEAHLDSSTGHLIPSVQDVTKGVQNVVRSAKHYGRIFRGDDGIFEVNQEQLDRVRMSKCKMEG
jgi:mannose-6-phosphate isomerase class I